MDREVYGEMISTQDSGIVVVGSMTEAGYGDLAVFVTKAVSGEDAPNTLDNLDTTYLVGLKEIGEAFNISFGLYPNPSSDKVKIIWDELESRRIVCLFCKWTIHEKRHPYA